MLEERFGLPRISPRKAKRREQILVTCCVLEAVARVFCYQQTAADFEPHLNCIGTHPRPDLPVGTSHPPRRKQPPHFEIPPSPPL